MSVEIKQGSKLSIAAACFPIYAFQELKEQLSQIEELRFIFTSPTFVTEKAKKERREFYIPRLTRERSLYGTEFEIKLRNELTQKAIARECAEWIRQKVTFKSNVSDKSIQGQIVVDGVGYTPINNFTTVELGCEKGNVISTTIVKDESLARTLLADFNEIWNDSKVLQVVTDEVIDSITAAYNENSPDFIYFVTLYNIFSEFLEDVSEDVLPNEATGFKESKIWGMLYNFQKDAALAIINKLEKYNGCILADSVGLGKTFTALAVIKYYENRNKSVLVLCPKKLTNNWNTYKDNYVNNPIAADRLRYDVLYHTDLNRTHGNSNGLDLSRLNWGNYDLVVIDESHNFRNGGKLIENPDEETKDNRYVTLMKKVIRAGVKTKVLMLSATPVNNRFNDLKNQLALAYEGHTDYIDEKLNTSRSIDEIFKNAQRAFNTWSKWDPCDRTTENLLKMLDFDFFELLDSVTIARSRKHIQKYYDTSAIGTFPTRLKPISLRPHLTDLKDAINYNEIFEQLMLLNLTIYTPSHFILPSKMEKYAELYGDNTVNVGFTQASREQGIRRLMAINLMKRMESSVYSFNLTLERIKGLIDSTIDTINRFNHHTGSTLNLTDISNVNEFDGDDQDTDDLFAFGKKVKIDLADMDYESWRKELQKDAEVLELLTYMVRDITPEHDLKLRELFRQGFLDDREVEFEVKEQSQPIGMLGVPGMEQLGDQMKGAFSKLFPQKTHRKKMKVGAAWRHLIEDESSKLVDEDKITDLARERVEQMGIVFIDEIDKLASGSQQRSADISREGVQRDLLPIVEGSAVNTKYGLVNTDHILFIAAGAFHLSKPSDLFPELQGRFPLRAELEALGKEEFYRILTEPHNSLTRQYEAMLETEGVRIEFTDDGLREIAAFAEDVNTRTENIGARRLHTIMEKILADISFDASEKRGSTLVIDREHVVAQLADVRADAELSRFIL